MKINSREVYEQARVAAIVGYAQAYDFEPTWPEWLTPVFWTFFVLWFTLPLGLIYL